MSEHGFYHPSRGYWQTNGDPGSAIRSTYPAGTVEVPLKPGADHEWQGGKWVRIASNPAEVVEAARNRTVADREDILFALGPVEMGGAGLLTEDEILTLNANQFPPRIDAMLDAYPPGVRLRAKLELARPQWRRASPHIDTVGQALGLTPEQMDQIFGVAVLY